MSEEDKQKVKGYREKYGKCRYQIMSEDERKNIKEFMKEYI